MQHFEDYEYNHPLFNENIHADRLNKLLFQKLDEDYKDTYHELITDKDNVLIAFKKMIKPLKT